jgi:hypothetical protein
MNGLYVNGCSFSCGGGLDISEVKELYLDKGIIIQNHLEFSWPELLSKKLDIKLINDSVQGGSINRLIRTTYEYLLKTKFSKQIYYILELPPVWRDEIYSNKLSRFVNITHGNLKNPEFDRTEEVNGYSKSEFLKIHTNAIKWFESFIDYDVEKRKTLLYLIGLISTLIHKEINFLFLENDEYFRIELLKNKLEFRYLSMDKPFNKSFSTIKDEIGFFDKHLGVEGNKQAAQQIYNFIINNGIFILN